MLNYEKNVGNWATGYNISEEMQNPVHLLLLYEMPGNTKWTTYISCCCESQTHLPNRSARI